MKHRLWIMALALALAAIFAVSPGFLTASDHDDGETDTKGRNVNITDVYAFREIDQNPGAGAGNLILIMNVNPRSVARQQYYFSTSARYEIKIERAPGGPNGALTAADLAVPDVVLRFEFGMPSAPPGFRTQGISLTAIRPEGTSTTAFGTTTPLDDATPNVTTMSVQGSPVTVFAGLRQDPFFFDVEQFFRVRAGALGFGPAAVFRHPGVDFTWGYNVLSIVARVPIAFLAGGSGATTFDVYATVSVPDGAGGFVQVERLAQPAINEGLLITNEFLNTLNAVGPDTEATLLALLGAAGGCPAGLGAFPILLEAASTLLAFGNTAAQACGLAVAFLPDVMRIDTTQASGYARAANNLGRPVRGRMILDDVIDITLSVIVPGKNAMLESDNVNYNQPVPINETGHRPLLLTFPYLAAPN